MKRNYVTGIAKFLQIPSLPLKPTIFLSDIIEKTYTDRMKTGYKRNDIIDACIDAMNKSEEIEEFKNDREAILVANAAMLFFAGFDTQGENSGVTMQKHLYAVM